MTLSPMYLSTTPPQAVHSGLEGAEAAVEAAAGRTAARGCGPSFSKPDTSANITVAKRRSLSRLDRIRPASLGAGAVARAIAPCTRTSSSAAPLVSPVNSKMSTGALLGASAAAGKGRYWRVSAVASHVTASTRTWPRVDSCPTRSARTTASPTMLEAPLCSPPT